MYRDDVGLAVVVVDIGHHDVGHARCTLGACLGASEPGGGEPGIVQ